MRTKFIMHSGARTIGGVICSITYGHDRVIFEMGSVYDPEGDIFDGKSCSPFQGMGAGCNPSKESPPHRRTLSPPGPGWFYGLDPG